MKLLQLLTSLSKEEIKLLRKAVISPLYTTNVKVLHLYELLKPQHPNFDSSKKGKLKLFKKIFGTSKYDDYKLRRLFSELTRVVEDFLIFQDMEAEKVERQKCLITAYNKRGLYLFFKKETDDLLAKLENSTYQNADYHSNKIELLKAKHFHPNVDRYDLKDNTLSELSHHLDVYFSLSKVQLSILLKNEEKVLNRSHRPTFLETIEQEANSAPLKNKNLLQIYLKAIQLLQPETGINFEEFETQFFQNLQQLDIMDRQIIYEHTLNHIIRENNRRTPNFSNTLVFKWQLFGLDNNFFVHDGKMSETTFSNLITIGSKIGKFEWVEQFIEKFKHSVETDDMDNMLVYCKGVYHFAKGEYNIVLKSFSTIQPKLNQSFQMKGMIAKALFEKFLIDDNYFETLNAHLQAYENYLQRDVIFAAARKLRYQHFIKITKTLAIKIFQQASKIQTKNWIIATITTHKPIYSEAWLLKKAENL